MLQETRLSAIVRESQLEPTKAKAILEQFQDYFQIASEWEIKAKGIVVTKEDQKADMEMARVGRLFLKDKRIAVEKARKSLKEQALREGKAIDGIANVLKALIVPIEEYLDKQEHFVEIKAEEKREAMQVEIEARIEAERIAEEKAIAEEEVKIRLENERLKKEAEEREKKIAIERKKQTAKLEKEREKAAAEKAAIEEKARKEREAKEKELAEQRAESEAEQKAKDEELAKEREQRLKERMIAEDKSRRDRIKAAEKAQKLREIHERLAELTKNQITCPKCNHKFQLEEGKR